MADGPRVGDTDGRRGADGPTGGTESEGRRQLPMRDRILGLLLLLGIVALLVYLRTPEEPSPMEARLLPPAAPLDSTWVRDLPDAPFWRVAIEHYEEGRYAQAAVAFDAIATRGDSDASLAQLFLGTCYLLEARSANAELALRLAARSLDPRVSEEARWRLAVSLLREDQMDAGRAELEAIAQGDGPHRDVARLLLAQLATRSSLPH